MLGFPVAGAAELNRLTVECLGGEHWPRLSLTAASNRVVRLEASRDLAAWREVARSHDQLIGYPERSGAGEAQQYYRATILPRTATDDWKNQILFPNEPLLSPPPAYGDVQPRWVKFAIVLAEPHRVYFQDSTRYAFHADFARARLAPFQGMTRAEFDAVSLRRANQQVVLGAVLFAPTPNLLEVGIQFVGQDPYGAEEVAGWFDQVRSSLVVGPGVEAFYFPTFEQQRAAEESRLYFEQRRIALSSSARWVIADECYASGWALGRLVFAPAAEVEARYRDGRLRPDDILVIDALPAEVPPVAGVVTLVPATPNAHVALLAQSSGIPCVYFAEAAERERVLALVGQEVVLRADGGFFGITLVLASVEGQLTPEVRQDLLDFKKQPPLQITPKAGCGTISLSAEGLRPADIRHVGGKAANFGLLRRAIPSNAPDPAMAFTFDLWEAYLDQQLPGGRTLRSVIDEALAGYAWPPDMAAVKAALAEVRDWVTDTADFGPEQRAAVLAALQAAGFTPDRNIRFRSSTNVEDSEQYSGAGLYDSFSGCLADELDDDTAGPSQCDPTETRERGVFRALRKVYASFYNDNAFLERLRLGVEEAGVGMAVLVHPSTPDDLELANGVATVRILKGTQPGDRSLAAVLVTQAGAHSVANPEANALPEEVEATLYGSSTPYLNLKRTSGLVPLGDHVLDWEGEYRELTTLLDRAAKAYEAEFPARRQLLLDFEYKKVAGGRLLVKQIRALPLPADTATLTPWLVNETNRHALVQGEYGNAFAFHRLKSQWRLPTATVRLTEAGLAQTFYGDIEVQFLDGLSWTQLGGPMAGLPGFGHRRDGENVVDTWTWGTGSAKRVFELHTWLPRQVVASRSPIVFLRDGWLALTVTYGRPQPVIDYAGPGTTLADNGLLAPVNPVTSQSLLQVRKLAGSGISIETRFYWPPAPTGPSAGYTAPLQAWVETRIDGLTSQPIVLRDDLAQTYHPGHHNFVEEFLFDPHLEPGLDPALRAELSARNIRAVYGTYEFERPTTFWIWGLDDTLRPLEGP